MKKPYIVGITGGSASGKTLFLNSLINSFSKEQVCLVSQDNYYKSHQSQLLDRNGVVNYDVPESIDFSAYAQDIRQLLAGQVVERPEYVFNQPGVTPKTIVLRPAPIVVVEGIFVFYSYELASLLNLKLFIDAKDYIKLARRIKRDKVERGYELDDVLYRYENHVAPSYEKYIEPFKYDADMVIPNNDHFNNALEVIVAYLKSKL